MRVEICQVKDNGQGQPLEAWDMPVPPAKGDILFIENGTIATQVERVHWAMVNGKLQATIVVVPVR